MDAYVVTSQPTVEIHRQVVVQQKQSEWSSGLFDCCQEPVGCIAATFCLACYQCHLSNKVGEACIMPCCVPGSMVTLRAMKRVQHNIPGSVLSDCCTILWCPCCALTQLKRHHDATSHLV
ncbi:cornifelin-like [Anneissia japonica]|uniref:cornifelin-like n=1 Tax=Anneissia japonica TaxID=1529436 RepID=UPI001425BA3B|nr:cornifelin-like [Anneissia japonica]